MQVRFILAEMTFHFIWTENYMSAFPTLTHILFILREEEIMRIIVTFS